MPSAARSPARSLAEMRPPTRSSKVERPIIQRDPVSARFFSCDNTAQAPPKVAVGPDGPAVRKVKLVARARA
eukprot:9134015-Lingulodinium_polyedra.AAC.1